PVSIPRDAAFEIAKYTGAGTMLWPTGLTSAFGTNTMRSDMHWSETLWRSSMRKVLSRRREARLPLHQRGEWIGSAPVLDQRLSKLRHQTPLHYWQGATDHAMGTRARSRSTVQQRLDEHPEKMRQRRETVEHPFGTIKARMGATHFLMKTL